MQDYIKREEQRLAEEEVRQKEEWEKREKQRWDEEMERQRQKRVREEEKVRKRRQEEELKVKQEMQEKLESDRRKREELLRQSRQRTPSAHSAHSVHNSAPQGRTTGGASQGGATDSALQGRTIGGAPSPLPALGGGAWSSSITTTRTYQTVSSYSSRPGPPYVAPKAATTVALANTVTDDARPPFKPRHSVSSRQPPREPLAAANTDTNPGLKSPSNFTFKEKQMYFAKEIENQPDDLRADSPPPPPPHPHTPHPSRDSVLFPKPYRPRSSLADRGASVSTMSTVTVEEQGVYQPRLEPYRQSATFSLPTETFVRDAPAGGNRREESYGTVSVTGTTATRTAPKSAAHQAVRDRLNETIKRQKENGKKAGEKKRFHLDPERMKKLRALLLKKAAEDIKADQEKRAQERRHALTASIGQEVHSNVTDVAELRDICTTYHERIRRLQEDKYDLEVAVRGRDYVLNEMTIDVNQLRGKFIKPSLKSVTSTVASDKESATMQTKNRAFARSFRRSLRATAGNTSDDATWRAAQKTKVDWMRQISRRSDFDDISEKESLE